MPENAAGIVAFVHGSGSSRHSPRNRYVARVLNEAGLGTLLFDLLTPEEELDRANVFDIGLLARRLTEVTRWLRTQPRAAGAAVGYFGASTGAAAVVSRGGRPDLARVHQISRRQCRAAAERRFSLARMAADYERLYRAILEHPGRPTPERAGTGAP